MLLLALVLFGDFDHALERQDAVEGWRSCLHLSRKALERRKDRAEDRLIHLHSRLRAFALHSEIGVDRAPREFFRAAGARRHFHCIPPSRKSKSQVQAFGVYRFDLPRPRVSAGLRHGFEQNRSCSTEPWLQGLALVLSRKCGDLSCANRGSQGRAVHCRLFWLPLACSRPRNRATFFWCSV